MVTPNSDTPGVKNQILTKKNLKYHYYAINCHSDNKKEPQITFPINHEAIYLKIITKQQGVILFRVTPGGQIAIF